MRAGTKHFPQPSLHLTATLTQRRAVSDSIIAIAKPSAVAQRRQSAMAPHRVPEDQEDFGFSSDDESEMLNVVTQPVEASKERITRISQLLDRIDNAALTEVEAFVSSKLPPSATAPSTDVGVQESKLLTVSKNKSETMKRKSQETLRADDHDVKRVCESNPVALETASKILRERFGMEAFRLKQAAAITKILQGASCIVVFPTGGGKSLCYQVPALAIKEMDRQSGTRDREESGITIVVSPLIALMKDQVDALLRRGISAAVLDSTKTRDEYLATVDSMRNGTLDILYCAPERLNNEGFVGSMAHVRGGIRLLAVDEAHCISEWGHAFRPDYLKVARFAREIEAERVICLTATATPQVVKDVQKAFDIADECVFRTPTYRPNLRLLARSFNTKEESYPELLAFLKAHPGSSIIYITTQKQAEELGARLRKSAINARHFHAGMEVAEKISCQNQFMASDTLVIVATIAFGMGIDKANIRNVVHYDVPRSLEGYSQEIGRAGRDGKQSHCVLYLCAEDLHIREAFARGDLPSKSSVSALLREVFATKPIATKNGFAIESNQAQQTKRFDIRPTVLLNIYAQLELRFELLRASTPKYTSYQYVVNGSIASDTSRTARAIRAGAKKAAKWTHADVDVIARSHGLERSDLVAKLNEWNDSGLIELKAAGVVNIYHVLRKMPSTLADQQTIIDQLYMELETREHQDLDRMQQVLDLITSKDCIARTLAQHFGDSLPENRANCGHCTWCETHQAVKMITPPVSTWNQAAFEQILKTVPDRDDPRYLARIAFGIGSPGVTASKMAYHKVFGSMEDQDFMLLLKEFTDVCEKEL